MILKYLPIVKFNNQQEYLDWLQKIPNIKDQQNFGVLKLYSDRDGSTPIAETKDKRFRFEIDGKDYQAAIYSNDGPPEFASIQFYNQRYELFEERKYVTYGVQIDLTNPDPISSVTYTDDAAGKDFASPGNFQIWDDQPIFQDIKPCLLQNGEVRYYLNKNDFTKREDGTSSEIINGADGDVMIEFPRIGYSIIKSNDGTRIDIKITDDPYNENFCYYAFQTGTFSNPIEKQKIYIGAYPTHPQSDNSLMSLSNKTLNYRETFSINDLKAYVIQKGQGYSLFGYYQDILIKCLFILKFKSLNSYSSLGLGDAVKAGLITGINDNKGFTFGTIARADPVKFLGIESIYGGRWTTLWNLYVDSTNQIKSGLDINLELESIGQSQISSFSSFYLKDVFGNNSLGFFPFTSSGGSSSTFFCDLTEGGYQDSFYSNGVSQSSVGHNYGLFSNAITGPEGESSEVRLIYL